MNFCGRIKVRWFEENEMKLKNLLGWSSALCLSATMLQAQETSETEVLKKQLKEATEKFEKALREQREMIDALSKKLETIQKQQAPLTNRADPATPAVAQAQPGPSAVRPQPEPPAQPWSPSQPITLARAGSAYMNVSFGALLDAGGSTARDVSK